MIISTMNDLPGYEIDEVLGEVFGLTVRSRNVGSQIGASLKSLVGGELKGMTKMLAEGRTHAQERLVEEAEAKGANAVIAFAPSDSASSIIRSLTCCRLSINAFVIPLSSPPRIDLSPAPICEPTLRERTVSPITSPKTSSTS